MSYITSLILHGQPRALLCRGVWRWNLQRRVLQLTTTQALQISSSRENSINSATGMPIIIRIITWAFWSRAKPSVQIWQLTKRRSTIWFVRAILQQSWKSVWEYIICMSWQQMVIVSRLWRKHPSWLLHPMSQLMPIWPSWVRCRWSLLLYRSRQEVVRNMTC